MIRHKLQIRASKVMNYKLGLFAGADLQSVPFISVWHGLQIRASGNSDFCTLSLFLGIFFDSRFTIELANKKNK